MVDLIPNDANSRKTTTTEKKLHWNADKKAHYPTTENELSFALYDFFFFFGEVILFILFLCLHKSHTDSWRWRRWWCDNGWKTRNKTCTHIKKKLTTEEICLSKPFLFLFFFLAFNFSVILGIELLWLRKWECCFLFHITCVAYFL